MVGARLAPSDCTMKEEIPLENGRIRSNCKCDSLTSDPGLPVSDVVLQLLPKTWNDWVLPFLPITYIQNYRWRARPG
jgi:hypothetical protein